MIKKQKINYDKEIENKLKFLQNKLDVYDSSLENIKKQYEDQILYYQKELNDLNSYIEIINIFFNNISNKYVNLNLNDLNISILKQNFSTIEKYIYKINEEIRQKNFGNEEYPNYNNKEITNGEQNLNSLKNNYNYNSFGYNNKISFDSNNLFNNNYINNNLNNNFNNFKIDMKNKNEINNDFSSLERRVFMLENKLKVLNKNTKTINREITLPSDNTEQNLKFFQNGILTEKMRPLSVKNNNKNIAFNKSGKIKKRKTKNKMKGS